MAIGIVYGGGIDTKQKPLYVRTLDIDTNTFDYRAVIDFDFAKYEPVSITMASKERMTPFFEHMIQSQNKLAIGLLELVWIGSNLLMQRVQKSCTVNLYYTTK